MRYLRRGTNSFSPTGLSIGITTTEYYSLYVCLCTYLPACPSFGEQKHRRLDNLPLSAARLTLWVLRERNFTR